MTMMITKFHRLIQNKVVWIIFSLLVVVSFVFWGTYDTSVEDRQEMVAPATLHGKPVAPEVFQAAKFSTFLSFVLQTGQPIPYTSDLDERIKPLAYRRIAALEVARRLGLEASNEEVISGLSSQAFLQTNGEFDNTKYEAFINEDLAMLLQGRISKSQFEQHIREEITLNKARQMVQQTVLVSPQDVEVAYHLMNDRYRGVYTLIAPEQVAEEVTLSDEEVEAYFRADPEAFELPEQVRVKYVYIPASNYVAGAEISAERIRAYYDENLDLFQETATNGLSAILDGAEDGLGDGLEATAADPGAAITYRALEDVEDEIRETLRAETARRRAADAANELVSALIPDRYGQAPEFEEQAESMGFQVERMAPFSEFDPLPDLGGSAEDFKLQALRLYPNPEEYFSNPIIGDRGSYVVALEERIPPRVPELGDVRERVRRAALVDAERDAVMDLAQRVKAALEDAAADASGDTNGLERALEPYDLALVDTDWFTSTNGLEEVRFADDIRMAAMGLNPGEVAEPMPTPVGTVVLLLREHEPAEVTGLLPIQEELAAGIRRQYASGVLQDWEDYLLLRGEFRERTIESEDEGTDGEAERGTGEDPAADSGGGDATN